MSGFLAVAAPPGAAPDREALDRLTARLAFRGPDGTATEVHGRAGLGHARLATGDARDAAQPAQLDGAWIAADARIDARDDLLAALRRAGRRVDASAADPLLVLHAYHAWGEDAPAHLLGDFSFAVWDGARQRLFCARDPLGARMLYAARTEGAVVAGNTLDVVRRWPGVDGGVDEAAIADFLLFGAYMDPAATAYTGVRCVPPGHTLTAAHGEVRIRGYWRLPEPEPLRLRTPAAYAERFVEVFGAAVRDRIAGGRAGVLLSGGRDSTAVAAAAVHLTGGGAPPALSARTLVYAYALPDEEGAYAARAAHRLGIPHAVDPVDAYLPFDGWGERVPVPEPTATPLQAGFADQCRRLRAWAPVGLSGHGGDVTLRESRARLAKLLAGGHLVRAAAEAAGYWRVHGQLPHPGLRTWLRERTGGGGPAALPEWLDPELVRRLHLHERLRRLAPRPAVAHPLRPEVAQQFASPLVSRVFEVYDPGFTGVPLAFGHPFLDLRVVELALSIPPRQWYNDKGLLRLAMDDLLPEAVVRRPKTPLAGEPNEAALRAAGANWHPPELVPAVRRFVDVPRVPRFAGGRAEAALDRAWIHLRVPALSLWLEAAGRG